MSWRKLESTSELRIEKASATESTKTMPLKLRSGSTANMNDSYKLQDNSNKQIGPQSTCKRQAREVRKNVDRFVRVGVPERPTRTSRTCNQRRRFSSRQSTQRPTSGEKIELDEANRSSSRHCDQAKANIRIGLSSTAVIDNSNPCNGNYSKHKQPLQCNDANDGLVNEPTFHIGDCSCRCLRELDHNISARCIPLPPKAELESFVGEDVENEVASNISPERCVNSSAMSSDCPRQGGRICAILTSASILLLIDSADAKGLVGKLPGNPASCPEEPCNSDPQHVLYALKWTSLGFACCLLLPLLMYGLSKLFSKMRSMCSEQVDDSDGEPGDREDDDEGDEDDDDDDDQDAECYDDEGANANVYSKGTKNANFEAGNRSAFKQRAICDSSEVGGKSNNSNLSRNLDMRLHSNGKNAQNNQKATLRNSVDVGKQQSAPGRAKQLASSPPTKLVPNNGTGKRYSQQTLVTQSHHRMARPTGGRGGSFRRVHPAPAQLATQTQRSSELPLLEPLLGAQKSKSNCTGESPSSKSSQVQRRKSNAMPSVIMPSQQRVDASAESHRKSPTSATTTATAHYPNQQSPEAVAAAQSPEVAQQKQCSQTRYIDGCVVVDLDSSTSGQPQQEQQRHQQRRDTLALPNAEDEFGPQHRHSIDGSILSTMVLAMQLQQQQQQQQASNRRQSPQIQQGNGGANSNRSSSRASNYQQQLELQTSCSPRPTQQTQHSNRATPKMQPTMAPEVEDAIENGVGASQRPTRGKDQRELHAIHKRQLHEYKEQIEHQLWLNMDNQTTLGALQQQQQHQQHWNEQQLVAQVQLDGSSASPMLLRPRSGSRADRRPSLNAAALRHAQQQQQQLFGASPQRQLVEQQQQQQHRL